MAFMKTVASWLMMVSSRLSFWTFMPMGNTPMIATSAKPMIARLMAISTIVKARWECRARNADGAVPEAWGVERTT